MVHLKLVQYAAAITGIVLLLISCNNDDDVVSEKDLIAGTWKMTAQQRISGKDGTLLQNEEVTGCDTLENYIFTREGTFIFTNYRQTTNGECERREARDVKGAYTYASNTLTFTENENQDTIAFHVPVLTATAMHLKEDAGDYNGDGVKDFDLIIFNK